MELVGLAHMIPLYLEDEASGWGKARFSNLQTKSVSLFVHRHDHLELSLLAVMCPLFEERNLGVMASR